MIIIRKKEKHITDIYLIFWLIVLSGYMIIVALKLYNFDICLSFLFYVFLYFYIVSVTRNFRFKTKHLVHILPFTIACLLNIFFNAYFIQYRPLIMFLMSVLFIVYFFLIRRMISNYSKYANMNYSTSDRADLSWIQSLLYYLSLAYLTAFGGYVFHLSGGTKMRPEFFDIVLFLIINAIGLKGIRKNAIFVIRNLPEAEPDREGITDREEANGEAYDSNEESSYLSYGLKQSEAQLLGEKLIDYMNSEKPYINPDLNLRDLAEHVEVYPHYVTQVLNTLFNQNFYDFVNTYRVAEAKKLLKDLYKSKKMPILTIAYNCGFNSKSSFNRIFKQKTGLTPSEYREQNAPYSPEEA
jgi:AraC-like DNA-binding protein